MTSDLLSPSRNIYAVVLAADQPSPIAPESDDEKTPAEAHEKAKENADATPAGETKEGDKPHPTAAKPPAPPKPVKIDLAGIENRIVALPLPAGDYLELVAGKPGTLYFRQTAGGNRFAERTATLNRFVFDTRKTEKLAEAIEAAEANADAFEMATAPAQKLLKQLDGRAVTGRESGDDQQSPKRATDACRRQRMLGDGASKLTAAHPRRRGQA